VLLGCPAPEEWFSGQEMFSPYYWLYKNLQGLTGDVSCANGSSSENNLTMPSLGFLLGGALARNFGSRAAVDLLRNFKWEGAAAFLPKQDQATARANIIATYGLLDGLVVHRTKGTCALREVQCRVGSMELFLDFESDPLVSKVTTAPNDQHRLLTSEFCRKVDPQSGLASRSPQFAFFVEPHREGRQTKIRFVPVRVS